MAAILDNLTGSTNIILKGDHQRGIWPKFGFIPSSVSEEESFQRFPIFQQIRSHGSQLNFGRPSKEYHIKVWSNLTPWFWRKRSKCEKLLNARQPSDDKSSCEQVALVS